MTQVTIILEDRQGNEERIDGIPFEKIADVGVIKIKDRYFAFVPKNSIGYAVTFREAKICTWDDIKGR